MAAALDSHYSVATLASLLHCRGISSQGAQCLAPTGESGAQCPDRDPQYPRRFIVCQTFQCDEHDSRVLRFGQLVKRPGHGPALDVRFLPGGLGHGWLNCLQRHHEPFTSSAMPGVQKDMVEHTEKPAPHTALSLPELLLSQGPFEAVLYQIISGVGIAEERQRITV
jgi:hypothetical protein